MEPTLQEKGYSGQTGNDSLNRLKGFLKRKNVWNKENPATQHHHLLQIADSLQVEEVHSWIEEGVVLLCREVVAAYFEAWLL